MSNEEEIVQVRCSKDGPPPGDGWRRAPVLMGDYVVLSGVIKGDKNSDNKRVYLRCDPTNGTITFGDELSTATTFYIEPATQRILDPVRVADAFFLRVVGGLVDTDRCSAGFYVRYDGATTGLVIGDPDTDGRRGVRFRAEPTREEWQFSDYVVRFGDRVQLRVPVFSVEGLTGVDHVSCADNGDCHVPYLVEEVEVAEIDDKTGESTGYTTIEYHKTDVNTDALQWFSFRCPGGGLRYFRSVPHETFQEPEQQSPFGNTPHNNSNDVVATTTTTTTTTTDPTLPGVGVVGAPQPTAATPAGVSESVEPGVPVHVQDSAREATVGVNQQQQQATRPETTPTADGTARTTTTTTTTIPAPTSHDTTTTATTTTAMTDDPNEVGTAPPMLGIEEAVSTATGRVSTGTGAGSVSLQAQEPLDVQQGEDVAESGPVTPASDDGVPWWGWLLIGIVAALVLAAVAGLVFYVIKRSKQQDTAGSTALVGRQRQQSLAVGSTTDATLSAPVGVDASSRVF